MQKNILFAVLAIVVLAGAGGYYMMNAPTKAPSQIAVTPTTTSNGTQATEPTPSSTQPVLAGFNIVPESSKASFSIYEKLRGEDVTVIGTTNQITGAVEMDRMDLSKATFSEIRVNARTFQTDSTQRDNTTRRAILKTESDANEFITLKPTSVTGAPASAEIGTEFTYTIKGDLTITGVTKEVTFDGKGKFVSETEFVGSAEASVKRSDYNLIVPDLPFLADVADNVGLSIEFTAKK